VQPRLLVTLFGLEFPARIELGAAADGIARHREFLMTSVR
jgi:hypothetical protein